MTVPYAEATSGGKARDEIVKLLRKFGCGSIGFLDHFEDGLVILQFTHRGRAVQLKASAAGWAKMYLDARPWNPRLRKTEAQYEQSALEQGLIAVNSILRDWVKGQVTAVECGMLSFDAAFMPYMLTSDGRTVVERVASMDLLPPPKE